MNSKDFNNYDDFINFLKDHNEIKTIKDFKTNHGNLYYKYIKLRQRGIITKELPLISKRKSYNLNTDYKSLNDFQEYINEFKLSSANEFREKNKSLYNRALRLGYYKKLNFIGKINYNNFDSLYKIQNFVIENNISSRKELKLKYVSIYRRYIKLVKENPNDDIIFKTAIVSSTYEKLFLEVLVYYNILFKSQFIIKDDNGKIYRYDFFLKDYNTLIEIHGRQHFEPDKVKDIFSDCDNIRNNDLAKYNLAKEKEYKIYYFTYDKASYERAGYFTKVYTNIDDLFNSAGIPMNVNNNYKEDINNVFKFLYRENDNIIYKPIEEESSNNYKEDKIDLHKFLVLDDFNKFINERKIRSVEELKQKYKSIHSKAERLKLCRDLNYYESSETTRELRSIDDANRFILNNKVVSLSSLRNLFDHVYYKAHNKKWINDLVFYELKEDDMDSIDKINDILSKNKIESKGKLKSFSIQLFNYVMSNKLLDKLIFYKDIDIKGIKTVEDVNKILYDNKIRRKLDIKEFSPKLFNLVSRNKWSSKLKYYSDN